MKRIQALVIMIASLCSLTATAQRQQSSGTHRIEPLPRDLEIQLALSALPPHLRDNATVYVLNPEKGFEVARKGTNGFHALVARTGDDTFRGSWPLKKYRDDILYPISFDPAGSKAQMQVFLDAAEMQARGTPPQRLKQVIQRRYKTNIYKAPGRAGVSYMLSPILRTFTNPDANEEVLTANIPHVMYFAPNVSNPDVGGALPTAEEFQYLHQHGHWEGVKYPFVILAGPHGYSVQFLGATEREAVNKQYEPMLAELCKIKEVWCLPEKKDKQ